MEDSLQTPLRTITFLLFLAICLLPSPVLGVDCSGLPTSFTGDEFPTGDFFVNFANNPCYQIPLAYGKGQFGYGDLNSLYNIFYYRVNPAYQLIIVGSFPQTRYFSITAYDEHSSIGSYISDVNIVPLTSQYINPYEVGVPYVPGQQFAVPINFGGTPGNLETGCMMNGYNVTQNALDGTLRHIGMDWNSDTGFFSKYPHAELHTVDTPEHHNPNTAGTLLIRNYLDLTPQGPATNPYVIVRDVASGCAYPAAYAMDTLQIVTNNPSVGKSWQDNMQIQGHNLYETKYLPKLCFAADHSNSLLWIRSPDFLEGKNPDATYITANIPPGLPAALASAGEVMRVRLRLAIAPPTPCTNGCSRSGTEQQRYTSVSFAAPAGQTLASIADVNFVQDSNGYATLIVGTGATIPTWITAANGYTFLDLTQISNYLNLDLMSMRNILPSSSFTCSASTVPYRTLEYTPEGGLMDEYVPLVDFPAAASLPTTVSELTPSNSCGIFPTGGQAGIIPKCGVFRGPSATITSAITQCAVPPCSQFAAQAQAPITIIGGGFGEFPLGLPFIGTSNFLAISDITQNWNAGYALDACTVYIDSWATNRISIVTNTNPMANCPINAGDQLSVQIWNPQSGKTTPASFNVTAVAPTNWFLSRNP